MFSPWPLEQQPHLELRRDPVLIHETSIVWDHDPTCLPYVRADDFAEHGYSCRFKRFHPLMRVIGWSVISRSAGPAGLRRLFWLKETDRDLDPSGPFKIGCPLEAVDPLTLSPGVRGLKNSRAWGGPTEHLGWIKHEAGLVLPRGELG